MYFDIGECLVCNENPLKIRSSPAEHVQKMNFPSDKLSSRMKQSLCWLDDSLLDLNHHAILDLDLSSRLSACTHTHTHTHILALNHGKILKYWRCIILIHENLKGRLLLTSFSLSSLSLLFSLFSFLHLVLLLPLIFLLVSSFSSATSLAVSLCLKVTLINYLILMAQRIR